MAMGPSMGKVSFPARCAVAVVCGEHLVSQVYPASVPIEVFIDNVVELLNDELKRRGFNGLPTGVGYELHKANGVRLDVTKTLDELGVEDGATLALVPAVPGDSFEPQYESLSTGLARIGKKLFEPVTMETAAHTALVILSMVLASLLGLAVRQRLSTDSLVPAVVSGGAGLLVAGGAGAVWQWWPRRIELVDRPVWRVHCGRGGRVVSPSSTDWVGGRCRCWRRACPPLRPESPELRTSSSPRWRRRCSSAPSPPPLAATSMPRRPR